MKKLLAIFLLLAAQASAQTYGIIKGTNGTWPIAQCYIGSTLQQCTDFWMIGAGVADPVAGYGSDGDLFWRSDLKAFRTKTTGTWGALSFGAASFPLLAPNGVAGTSAPYSFASEPSAGLSLDSGFYLTLKSKDAVGVDQGGGATQLFGGKGTGLGSSGTVYIIVCPPNAASGSTPNTCSNIAYFQGVGNILMGGIQMASGSPALNQMYGQIVAAGRTDVSATAGGWAFRGAQGTGTGGGGGFSFGIAGASVGSSSVQNAYQNIFLLNGADGSFSLGGIAVPNPQVSTMTGVRALTTDLAGGNIIIQGGQSGPGNASGGFVQLDGGAGSGTGVKGFVQLLARTFATLSTPANGSLAYCSDCTIANPCAGSGTGAIAKRLNAVWVCN